MILLDANILLRMTNGNDPDYQRTRDAVFKLRQSDRLLIVSQTLYEFWAVATRSIASNGLGLSPDRTTRWIAAYRRMFPLLPDPADLANIWASIVAKHQVSGFRAHDARYIAVMQSLNIPSLLTYNVRHFKDFGAHIIDPAQV